MEKEPKIATLLKLFISFFRIGLFTFGGGYAMIPLIQKEAVNKRKWTTDNEILNIITISESTPGPIAVNAATYIGYKASGVFGSIFATMGLVTPSFCIILLFSFFYDTLIKVRIIDLAFKGIRVGVIILLINALIKLSKNLKRNIFNLLTAFIALAVSFCFSFFNLSINIGNFSISISLILIITGLIIGLIFNRVKGDTK